MRSFLVAVALGAAFSFTPCVMAGNNGVAHTKLVKEAKGHHGMKGTISSVNADSVVVSVTDKKGTAKDHTIKTDSNTKITLDGKDAKVTDLKAGQEVTITPGAAHGDPAAAIDATSAAK
jgi:hypothetical protein